MLLYLFTTKHIFILYLFGTINVKFLPIKIIKINWFDNKPRIILGETATSEKKLTSTCPLFLFIMLWRNKIRYLDFGIGRLVTRYRSRPIPEGTGRCGHWWLAIGAATKALPNLNAHQDHNAMHWMCTIWSNATHGDQHRISPQIQFSGCVQLVKSGRKVIVASFVVIWQNLFNHGLTRLKRFVSTFTDKLCN
jgi:hypothetical protein